MAPRESMPGKWMARVCQSMKDRMVKFNKRRRAVADTTNSFSAPALARKRATVPAITAVTYQWLYVQLQQRQRKRVWQLSYWSGVDDVLPACTPLMSFYRSIACSLIREPPWTLFHQFFRHILNASCDLVSRHSSRWPDQFTIAIKLGFSTTTCIIIG